MCPAIQYNIGTGSWLSVMGPYPLRATGYVAGPWQKEVGDRRNYHCVLVLGRPGLHPWANPDTNLGLYSLNKIKCHGPAYRSPLKMAIIASQRDSGWWPKPLARSLALSTHAYGGKAGDPCLLALTMYFDVHNSSMQNECLPRLPVSVSFFNTWQPVSLG